MRAVVPDGDGGFLAVTQDPMVDPVNPPDGGTDIGLIHLDAGLSPLSVHDGPGGDDPCGALLVGGYARQTPAQVLPAGGSTFLLTGEERGFEPADGPPRVFVQKFDDAGRGLLGEAPLFPADPQVESADPFATLDGTGGFLVGWQRGPPIDAGTGSGGAVASVLVQRFDALGSPAWPAPVQVSLVGATPVTTEARMVTDGDDGAYLTWSERRDGEARNLPQPRLQRVAADGRPLFAAGGVRIDPLRDVLPRVVLVPDPRGVIAVYAADRIRAQLFSPTAGRLWGDGGVVVSSPEAGSPAGELDASEAPDGSLYVTWIETRDGRERILARRLRRDGTLPWPAPVTLATDRLGAFARAQAVLGDGSLALVLPAVADDVPGDTGNLDAQAVDLRGRVKAPPEGAPLCRAAGLQYAGRVFAPPGAPASAPAWPDSRTPPMSPPPVSLSPPPPAEALFIWSDARPGSGVSGSDGFFVQRLLFSSAPTLLLLPQPVTARQSEAGVLDLQGDDLQPGLSVDLGPGIVVTGIEATPIAADGPGDRLRIQFAVDPGAAIGTRPLDLLNPDGSRAAVPDVLTIVLDERRIDIDRNGRADGFDLAVLAASFGRGRDEPGYAQEADFDGSGAVDGYDLALLAARFGSRIEPG
ncbi:MAG TPA: hypothetical protein VFB95_09370 [Candidatus Cryosericum sp.]|nr:hypothetical protein [Candidatus Cryosericum sp.]